MGYFQFETGYLGAWRSPEFSSQTSFNEVVKFSLTRCIELLAERGTICPFPGWKSDWKCDWRLALGVQGVVYRGEGARPTIAMSYLRAVHSGDVPDLDLGSPHESVLFLASADLKGFHYDANFFFNDVINNAIHRAQFGQTLSVSHALVKKVRYFRRNMAFHAAVSPQRCHRELVGLNYNLRKKFRDRRGIQPWIYQHIHTVGRFSRDSLICCRTN